jgi:uncharacterized protein (DUF885 family)
MADIVADLKGLPIDEFFEESFKQLLLRDPEDITDLGIADDVGLRNDQLANLSDAYIKETHALEVALLELLRTYDRDALTPEQELSYDIYEWFLDDLVRDHKFMYYDYLVHHFLGSYHDRLIRFFTECHPITRKEDAEDYITRLSQVMVQVDQVLEGLKLREKTGIVPPKYIVTLTKEQITDYLRMNPGDPVSIDGKMLSLYSIFKEKLEEIDLSTEEKKGLLDATLTEIEESFIPAFVHLLDYVQYLETIATEDAGVWKFPDGHEYYAHVLRHETSTALTPEEMHERGLAEVDRIQKEMYKIFDELGYPHNESCGELLSRAITDAGYYDTSTQEGKDHCLEAVKTALDQVNGRLDAVVDIRPNTELVVVGDQESEVNFYAPGSLDNSRPGAFHVSLGGSQVHKHKIPTITYHETIPGHYFQISIMQELDLPLFRNVVLFNGYAEGWGMYAEQLAWELGLYEDSPYGNIGRLQLELLRAVYLVVDTGIHAKKWTRNRAKQYMEDTFGLDMYSYLVDRFIVWPGQATGYMVGMLKILELREKTMNVLGDEFDIKEFHKVVLGSGSMPLTITEKVVQDYIDTKVGSGQKK